MSQVQIPDFKSTEYTFAQYTRTVYQGGRASDPLVFLLHEIPNPTPKVFDLGRN